MLSYDCSNQFAIQIRLPFPSVPANEDTHTRAAHTLPTYLPAVCRSNCTPRCYILPVSVSGCQVECVRIDQQFQYTRVSIRYKGLDRTAQRTEICFRFETKQCSLCRNLNGCFLREQCGPHNYTACGNCWLVEGQTWRFVYHLPLDLEGLHIDYVLKGRDKVTSCYMVAVCCDVLLYGSSKL